MQEVWHRQFDGWWYATLREDGVRKQIKLLKAPNTKADEKRAEDQLVRELAERDYSQEKAGEEPPRRLGIVRVGADVAPDQGGFAERDDQHGVVGEVFQVDYIWVRPAGN
jgi:hypothetical protein